MRSVPTWNQSAGNKQSMSITQNNTLIRPPMLCYNCGQPDHMSRQCTEPRRSNQNRKTNVEHTKPLMVGGVTKKICQSGAHPTYLRTKVGACECDCVLDTGSEATIIPALIVERRNIVKMSHVLTAANGTSSPVLGEITVPIRKGNYETVMTDLVTEHVFEVMLEIDWLTENQAMWEFVHSQICIGNQCYQLRVQTGNRQWCRRVMLQEDVVIPARSEMDLPTRIV